MRLSDRGVYCPTVQVSATLAPRNRATSSRCSSSFHLTTEQMVRKFQVLCRPELQTAVVCTLSKQEHEIDVVISKFSQFVANCALQTESALESFHRAGYGTSTSGWYNY